MSLPTTSSPPPSRPSRPPRRRHPSSEEGSRAAIVLAIAAAFLAGASFGVLVVDFGAHVDGPGIGLEWSRPLGSEYGLRAGAVLCASLVQGALSLVAFGRARARSFGVLALFALGFVGMLAGAVGTGHFLLPAWWNLGCSQGHAYACYAAAGLAKGESARALDERACAGDVGSACLRIVREDPSRLASICEERARSCAGGGASDAASVRGRCRGLADICLGVVPPSR